MRDVRSPESCPKWHRRGVRGGQLDGPQAASIITVLLFGVGTDYALLITARYRQASATDADRFSAMGTAMLTTVAFTFIPALTLIFGRSVFWPRRPARPDEGSKVWRKVAHLVATTPRLVVSGVPAVLFVLRLGLVSYQQSFDFVSGFRVDTDSARGQTLVRDSFSPGEIAPASIAVRAETGLSSGSADTRSALNRDTTATLSILMTQPIRELFQVGFAMVFGIGWTPS